MSLSIVPLAESHFEGLRRAFDSIAREKRYLAFLQAPPLEQGLAFYRNIVKNDLCHFVALQRSSRRAVQRDCAARLTSEIDNAL
jgi:hypothetical protein